MLEAAGGFRASLCGRDFMATFTPIHSSKSSAAMQAALHVMDRRKKKATSGSLATRDSENDFILFFKVTNVSFIFK